MKYMLMICAGEDREREAPRMSIEEWVTEMDGRGVRLMGRPLQDPDTAATVRVREGETVVSDGPFAETREFIGGVCVLHPVDRDAAIALAAEFPLAAYHCVEARRFA